MTFSSTTKIFSFDPKYRYRSRTLDELNNLSDTINDYKFKLSASLMYYLQKYIQLLDIPRLCRALSIPGELAENFIEGDKTKEYCDGLDKVKYLSSKIVNYLFENYLKEEDDNNNNLIVSNLTNNQKEAICADINELSVYSKMCYDIETVKSDPLISNEYPYGNPFDHIIDIMNYGAIIIRLKYVSRNKSLPEEKVVSYHIMELKDKKVLGVHIQGDQKFSMYKQWGQGDEKLLPLYSEYNNTIIRWGKDEVMDVLNRKKSFREFLY